MSLKRQIIDSAPTSPLLVASCAIIATGCVSLTPEEMAAREQHQQAVVAEYRASLPRCSSDKECQAKWSAARRWVLDNCGFKLQHVTDDYMETFNIRDPASTNMWCRVTKSPTSETEYVIELENGVNNLFAGGGLQDARIRFNSYVNAAWAASN